MGRAAGLSRPGKWHPADSWRGLERPCARSRLIGVAPRRWKVLAIGVASAGVAVITAGIVAYVYAHREVAVSPGQALVSVDGLTVSVPDESPSCLAPATVEVSESARAVILTEWYPAGAGWCFDYGPGTSTITVRLRTPLGHRELVDGTTGRPLPWFDQRRELVPGYLPPGYTPREATLERAPEAHGPVWADDAPGLLVPPNVPNLPTCSREFVSPTGVVVITQVIAPPVTTSGEGVVVWVNGHRAIFRHGVLNWGVLNWRDGGQAIQVRGTMYGAFAFPESELLAIARSLLPVG